MYLCLIPLLHHGLYQVGCYLATIIVDWPNGKPTRNRDFDHFPDPLFITHRFVLFKKLPTYHRCKVKTSLLQMKLQASLFTEPWCASSVLGFPRAAGSFCEAQRDLAQKRGTEEPLGRTGLTGGCIAQGHRGGSFVLLFLLFLLFLFWGGGASCRLFVVVVVLWFGRETKRKPSVFGAASKTPKP